MLSTPGTSVSADIAGNESVERCLAGEADLVETMQRLNFRC
jgi:hypothetical protein